MKQSHLHVSNVPEKRSDIVEGASGLIRVIDRDENGFGGDVVVARLFRCKERLVTRCRGTGRHKITMRVQDYAPVWTSLAYASE